MDTMKAYAMKLANMENEAKVFDWEEAARIINKKKSKVAEAGLLSDYEWTLDTIYENGKANLNTNAFVDSIWATPMLILDDREEIECYRMESKITWNIDEKWPKSALAILEGKKD